MAMKLHEFKFELPEELVALHPARDVVVGLAVAEQDQPPQRHPAPSSSAPTGACISGKSMRGQSFHSRSRP